MSEKMITAAELADFLKCHLTTVYRMVHTNEIPFIRIGREYRFDRDAVVARLQAPKPAWQQSARSRARKRAI